MLLHSLLSKNKLLLYQDFQMTNLLCLLKAHGSAKQQEVKVGDQKKILDWTESNSFLLSKSSDTHDEKRFFSLPNLTSWRFKAPSATRMHNISFEIPDIVAIDFCLLGIFLALLKHFMFGQSYPIYEMVLHLNRTAL